MKRRLAAGASVLLWAWAVAFAGVAWGQAPSHPAMPLSGPSSLPSGEATLRGQVTDPDHPGATAALTVVLYALQPDGTPGIGSAQTASDGSFAFTAISNDPGIVYLVGVRYELIPYGERTQFSPGQRELEITLPVSRPTPNASALQPIQTTLQLELRGAKLIVLETHEFANPGSQAIYVPERERSSHTPPFQAELPDGAENFRPGVFNVSDGFEQSGRKIFYWGPLYTGEQEVRFGYEFSVEPATSVLALEKRFARAAGRIRVVTPEHGPRVASPDLSTGRPFAVEDTRLALLEGEAPTAGTVIQLRVQLPETTSDRTALSLGSADISVELDDTFLDVTQVQRLSVAPGGHLAGSQEKPLLHFGLPAQAQLVGFSPGAEQLGIQSVEAAETALPGKGISVLGPLPPGEHEFAFRYRIPTQDRTASLDLRFPLALPSLSVRAADTGLLIESDRLHRLRPEAIGTRTWMLREAFDVQPDEQISLRFEELDQRGPERVTGLAFLFGASAFVLFFVVGPLRGSRQEAAQEPAERSGPAHERDLVYATIRDLEHDFETGKVAEADYQRSRNELRTHAVELMRQEKQDSQPTCPACGEPAQESWLFCSGCGSNLSASEDPSPEPEQ